MASSEEDGPTAVEGGGYMFHYKDFKSLLQLWHLHAGDPHVADIARKALNQDFWGGILSVTGAIKNIERVTDTQKWFERLFERALMQEARNIQDAIANFMDCVHGLEESKFSVEERISESTHIEKDLKDLAGLNDKIGVYLWQMEQYAALNYKAFYKILLRYDQQLHLNTVQEYMPRIDKMLSIKVRLELPFRDLVIPELMSSKSRRLSTYEILSAEMRDEEGSDGESHSSDGEEVCTFISHLLPQLVPPIAQVVFDNYGMKDLQADFSASVIISLAGIPKAMSYAGLAGVPVAAGIATLYMPCLVYALLGSSRQIAISPQSVTCLLLAQLVDDSLDDVNDEKEKIAMTMMFTMGTGLVMVACGVLNLSAVFNFISRPVLSGFVSASALIAAFSTIKGLIKIKVKKSAQLHTLTGRIIDGLPKMHWGTTVISIIGIILMIALPKLQKLACQKLEVMQRCKPLPKICWFIMKVPSVIYIVLLGILLGGGLCEFDVFTEESTEHVVAGIGATSVAPFYSHVGEVFTCEHQSDNIDMKYTAAGSGAGLRSVLTNQSLAYDFATSDVMPSQAELNTFDVTAYPLAAAFICPMVNVPIIAASAQVTLVLDMATVAAIFTGEITSWSDQRIRVLNPNLPWDVAGQNVPIQVITRSDSSGTTAVFSEALRSHVPSTTVFSPGLVVNWSAPSRTQVDGNEGVIQTILSTPWSIGYTAWANESRAEISCAGFPINGGIVTTKLAWRQRIGELNSSIYHGFVWPIRLTNYVLVPSQENANRISMGGPRDSVCASRRWLYEYLTLAKQSDSVAQLHMLELMNSTNPFSSILCSNDRRLAGSQQEQGEVYECEKISPQCRKVKMVGYFPSSFLKFESISTKTEISFTTLLSNALLLSSVAILEHVANAKLYAERCGYHININKDLVAVGASNVLGAYFGSFVVAGGFSRSALNAKAKSQLSGLLSVFVSLLAVLTMAPVLSMLPDAVLNIILFVSVLKVIDYKLVLQLVRLGPRGRKDLLSLSIAFLATCIVGVVAGMILSMGFSLVIFVFNSAYPRILLLKRISGTMSYEAVQEPPTFIHVFGRHVQVPSFLAFAASKPAKVSPEDSEEGSAGITILKFEAPIWYANVARLCDRVLDEVHSGSCQGIVLDMSNVSWVDVTACSEMKLMFARIDEIRQHLVFYKANKEVESMLMSTCKIAPARFFSSLYKAELGAEMWGQEGDIKEAIKQGQEGPPQKSMLMRSATKAFKRAPTLAW